MRKILVILVICLSMLTLTSCKEKQEEIEERQEEVENLGGWQEKDEEVTGDALVAFNKAIEGLTGAKYEPIKLMASQVVAGMNYKILCDVTVVGVNQKAEKKVVIIYEDPGNNCSITSIEDYTE